MSRARIKRIPNERVENESDLVRLRQVGVFRHNKVEIDELVRIASTLIFDILGQDNCRVALEMNYNGDLFIEKISYHEEYYDYIFIHTIHEASRGAEIGTKLHKYNKIYYSREMRKTMYEARIIVEEEVTVSELGNFGLNPKGTYSCQSGHDDLAMTCLHLIPALESEAFDTFVSEWIETIPKKQQKFVYDKISNAESSILGKEIEEKKDNQIHNFYYSTGGDPFSL